MAQKWYSDGRSRMEWMTNEPLMGERDEDKYQVICCVENVFIKLTESNKIIKTLNNFREQLCRSSFLEISWMTQLHLHHCSRAMAVVGGGREKRSEKLCATFVTSGRYRRKNFSSLFKQIIIIIIIIKYSHTHSPHTHTRFCRTENTECSEVVDAITDATRARMRLGVVDAGVKVVSKLWFESSESSN